MGTSAVTVNAMNTYLRTEALALERRPTAVGAWQEGDRSRQKKASGDRQPSPYIDIQAESVAVMQTQPPPAVPLPMINYSEGLQRGNIDSSQWEDFPSSKALNYRPSKKRGGGIEFGYDNSSPGHLFDVLA